MRLSRSLDDFLANKSHVRVLRALFALPTGFAVSARETARRAGISHPRASASLRALAAQGLVKIHTVPRAALYTVNVRHLAARPLKRLFEWEGQVPDELQALLRQELKRHLPFVSAAFLFGSAARGEMSAASDIDLALICPPNRVRLAEREAERVGDSVHERFGNRLNVVVTSSSPANLQKPGRVGSGLRRRIVSEGISLLAGIGEE